MPSLTWLWNLSGGWSLALLNKDPAVHWWPCFRRPQQTNESVVWYSSSSALLWDLAGTGLPVRRACLCGSVCVCGCLCVSRVYSAGQPYLKQNESLSLHYHPVLTASLQPRRLTNFLYTKTNRKDRTKHVVGVWKRANIATASRQKPRQTERSGRMHRARKPAGSWKEAGMFW